MQHNIEAALTLAGTHPAIIDANGLAWQELTKRPLDLTGATGVIVGHDDGYDVYQIDGATLGALVAEIR